MNKKVVISVVVGALILVGVLAWLKLSPVKKKTHTRVVGECEVQVETITMPDATMTGIFAQGQELTLERGYYACNSPVPGDTVFYRYSEARNPVIKRVVAVEGDEFRVVQDESGRGWNLQVNGELVMAGEKPYYFGGQAPPTLSLYEKPRNNVLKKGELILFSTQPPGREDSGIFGLVAVSDLLGKVKAK